MKTILSKICGQKNNFKSKATTEWGKTNEPVARQEYIKLKAKDHKNLVLQKQLFVSCENPIFGASPDGIVSCEYHESGFLEIKCP